jgi:hypothetical protein
LAAAAAARAVAATSSRKRSATERSSGVVTCVGAQDATAAEKGETWVQFLQFLHPPQAGTRPDAQRSRSHG